MHTEIETERKFILTEHDFNQVLLGKTPGIDVNKPTVKERRYRYFDTPESQLLAQNITYSLRDRKDDYAITVKFPTSKKDTRIEYNARILSPIDFYMINPHCLQIDPVNRVREVVGNSQLIDAAQFTVETTRYDIFDRDQEVQGQLSLDKIMTNGVNLFELEIETQNEALLDNLSLFYSQFAAQETNLSKYQRVLSL